MYIISLVIVCLWQLTTPTTNLNLTIMDRSEFYTIRLLNYFNHSLENPTFRIDTDKCEPKNITTRFNLTIQEERQNITQVTLQAMNNGSLISLSNRTIIKTLTVPVQPIKLILAEGGLIFLVMFDDKMSRGNENRVSVVNISTVLPYGRLMNCSDMAFDRKNYRIYVECGDGRGNFYNSILQLLRDSNNIVYAIRYLNHWATSNYKNCRQRKILYIQDQIVDGYSFRQSLMVYCPFSKMDANTAKAMVWSNNHTTSRVINFSACPTECCNHSQIIGDYTDRLLFVTNSAVYSYASGFCDDKQMISFEDFRMLKIGAADYTQDLYVLTKDYLYIKFPSLTNTEIIDIREEGMDPVGFSVTLDYIYIQMSNGVESHLNILKLTNTLPKLIYRSSLPVGSVIGDTGNYFSLADYFYLYDTTTSTLAIQSFIGTSLVIKYNFLSPLQTENNIFIVCITNNNQSLLLNISVRNFRDKSLYILTDNLFQQFTQQIVSIDLRQRVQGPLTEFHLADWNLEDGAYITGLELINLNLNSDLMDKVLAIRFTEDSNGTLVTIGYYINQTIYFHECNLVFNELISGFEVSNCNGFIDRHINQNEIDLTKLKGIESVVGYDKIVYILHDKQKILICQQFDKCIQKIYTGQGKNISIEKLKVAYGGRSPEIMLLLYNSTDSTRTVYIYSLGDYNEQEMSLMLEISYTKIPELRGNIGILDMQSDFIYTGSLALLTNTSHIYTIQRQRSDGEGNMPYLCHVTDVINGSELFGCDRISHFFLMASEQHRRRLVIICQPLSKTDGFLQIVQFVVNNPFDVQLSREYPTYDYTVESDGHYSDNRYIYINATNRNKTYYLVYDYLQSSPNVLLYRIPVKNTKKYKFAVGTMNDNKEKYGLGYLDGNIYSVMDALFISQMEEMQERRVSLAVTNDVNQLVMFNFSITVDLNSSKLSYDSDIPVLEFSKNTTEHEFLIKLNKLCGPLQDINITTSSDDSQELIKSDCGSYDIIRQELIEPDRCLSYYGKPYGQLFDFTSMTLQKGMELVLTSTYLMCLHNKKLVSQKPWSQNCELRKFENSIRISDNRLTELAILLCRNEFRNLMYLVEVDQQCQFTTQLLSGQSVATYYDVQASYPHLMLETPILLPQNKDYYICILNESLSSLEGCTPLVRGLQDNFLSIDFDIGNGYGLVLEKGLGVYDVRSYEGKDWKKWNATWWIGEKKLENDLEIVGPFSYIHFVSIGENKLIFELGLSYESYEIEMTFYEEGLDPGLAILFHYKKYMDCKYSRDSNPNNFDKFIIKTCQTQPITNYLLAGMAPILTKPARRFVQIYLREGDLNQSWPVTMEQLTVFQRFTVSGDFLVVNSKTNTICYYNLNNQIKWKIQLTLDERQNASSCNATITLENEYYSVDYPLILKFLGKEIVAETWLGDWWLHIVSGVIILFSSVFFYIEMRPRRKAHKKIKNIFKQKKSGTQKNIFSNEFEIQLRKIQSQKVI